MSVQNIDQNTVPSSPDPTLTMLLAALLRWLLTGLGACGVLTGVSLSQSSLMVIAGSTLMIFSLVWSIYQKIKSQSRSHASAVASANAGQPLMVTATTK